MSWYLMSLEWISEQRTKNPEMTREELKKHCSKHYPWAERKGWAYKSFLRAIRHSFGDGRKSVDITRQKDLFR